MPENRNTWLAVVNRHAGNGKTAAVWRKARKLLDEAGINHDDKFTDCKFHAVEIAYRAAEEGYRNFIVSGGDGTIHEVLDGIMKFVDECELKAVDDVRLDDFRLATIPVGSGNDWVKVHGIGFNVVETVRLIAEDSFVRQDVVKVETLDVSKGEEPVPLACSYMVNIAGVGFDARVCERVNVQKDRGRKGKMLYINSLLYNLFHYKSSPVKVVCDGMVVSDGLCFSIALGTGKFSGGGMRQTPLAVYDDGLLDYTIIPAYPVWRILYEAPKLFTGKILSVRELTYGRCKSVTVIPGAAEGELVEADGEIVGHAPVRFSVLSQQINVLHK